MDRIGASEYESLANASLREVFPEYDAEAMAVCFNLIRLANRITQDLEISIHRPHNVSFAGFRVLFAIRSVQTANPNDLARLSSVSTASMSSLLNTLERAGLVVRTADSSDKRKVLVTLTPEGTDLVSRTMTLNSQRESDWVANLTHEEREILSLLLRKLLAFRPPQRDLESTSEH